jgi:hypothetical protein
MAMSDQADRAGVTASRNAQIANHVESALRILYISDREYADL